jgi:hypothetical protein
VNSPVPRLLIFGAALWFLSGCGGSNSSVPDSSNTQQQTSSNFSCPSGQEDVMQYFAMSRQTRQTQFMSGQPNPIYTEVFPDQDFARSGYWFWLKSASAHGFDVKSFDQNYVYMRSTELTWTDNTTFKRFIRDLPIAARCVAANQPGNELQEPATNFQYFSSCQPYKSSNLGTAVNDLDAPALMHTGGDTGQVMTRILHYHYNCDANFQNCVNEEQFFLGKDIGEWQWKHYQNGTLVKSELANNLATGAPTATLPCTQSFE